MDKNYDIITSISKYLYFKKDCGSHFMSKYVYQSMSIKTSYKN